jgi:hypothetical protein
VRRAANDTSAKRRVDPGRAVDDDQRRRVRPALLESAAEAQPVLVALAAAERKAEQLLLPFQGEAQGHKHALGRLVGGPQLGSRPAVTRSRSSSRRWRRARNAHGVLADAGDRRLADHLLAERHLQQVLDVADRQAAQEADNDQRLQRVRARDPLAEHLALEAQLDCVADSRPLEFHRLARRLHRPRLKPLRSIAVAVARCARDR